MSDRPYRLLPRLDDDNRPFWTGVKRGELVFWRCRACRYLIHPPSPVCPRCLSRDRAPQPLSGRGVVVSYTLNHKPWNPTMPTPYAIALVELVEQAGLRLMTNVVGCPPEDVRIGMPVRAVFERHEDVWVPLFEPESV